MSERLRLLADEHVNTTAKLRQRLRKAVSVLKVEYRVLFPVTAYVDREKKRMMSSCGHYALQWVNNGETSVGSCYLVDLQATTPK